MKKQYGWVSEYKKKKFFESQKSRKEKNYQKTIRNIEIPNNKTIAVMLDLEGTVDYIDDEKAKLFIKQLDTLRKKFSAKTAYISISTHYNNSNEIKKVLDIISRNLSNHIKIGISFYFSGIYDYDKDYDSYRENGYNFDKVKTFSDYYVNNINFDNKWFAIVDDGINNEIYKNYQESHPMLLARPSQIGNEELNNNFMSIATSVKGIDGVIKIFKKYLKSIKDLSPEEILETQRKIIEHLSSYELSEKIWNREYVFLERYFSEGYADESDFNDILTLLVFTNQNQTPSKEELKHLKIIFEIMSEHFHSKDEKQNINRVLELQKRFSLPNSSNK